MPQFRRQAVVYGHVDLVSPRPLHRHAPPHFRDEVLSELLPRGRGRTARSSEAIGRHFTGMELPGRPIRHSSQTNTESSAPCSASRILPVAVPETVLECRLEVGRPRPKESSKMLRRTASATRAPRPLHGGPHFRQKTDDSRCFELKGHPQAKVVKVAAPTKGAPSAWSPSSVTAHRIFRCTGLAFSSEKAPDVGLPETTMASSASSRGDEVGVIPSRPTAGKSWIKSPNVWPRPSC